MLDFKLLHRRGSESGGIIVHERYSTDFTIDGSSLLDMIVAGVGEQTDLIGCFARDWALLNEHSLKQLLLSENAEAESGRRLLYICPECADIGCGAYGCKISTSGDTYVWSDFAFENGYEEATPIHGVGPFSFSANNYETVIGRASEI